MFEYIVMVELELFIVVCFEWVYCYLLGLIIFNVYCMFIVLYDFVILCFGWVNKYIIKNLYCDEVLV